MVVTCIAEKTHYLCHRFMRLIFTLIVSRFSSREESSCHVGVIRASVPPDIVDELANKISL